MTDFLWLARATSTQEHIEDLRLALTRALGEDQKGAARRLRAEIKRNEEDLDALLEHVPNEYKTLV